MTLKEELEILRGEPIEVFTGDPMDIPCIETSDPEKLCKHPVVSVHMITYNHEPYIRQAIEGVMMQKTDFELELVIGEDASTDRTREICFEYQKRYPDKIRVLWWHENLRKVNHPAGANGIRTRVHCRGEFIAFCEGDDYWIDPLKLQKQVAVMRENPRVGLCFCGSQTLHENGKVSHWQDGYYGFSPGLISGRRFFLCNLYSDNPRRPPKAAQFIMTATMLFRKSVYLEARKRFEIFVWRLALGDITFRLGLSALSDVYYLRDEMSVYRKTRTGVSSTNTWPIVRDGRLIRLYFADKVLRIARHELPGFLNRGLYQAMLIIMASRASSDQKEYIRRVAKVRGLRRTFTRPTSWPGLISLWIGFLRPWQLRYHFKIVKWFSVNSVPRGIRNLYG